MRVSAALCTFAALIAHDVTSQTIAAPPPNPTPPAPPSTNTPVDRGLTTSELVAPITPAETFPIELTATDKIPVVQNEAPDFAAVGENPSLTGAGASSIPVSAPVAAPQVGSPSLFNLPAEVVSAVEQSATDQPAPLVQTLNEAALLNKSDSGQPSVSTAASTVRVGSLTPAEIKALQQGQVGAQPKATTVTNAPAPRENSTTSPTAALVSANLAEQAAANLGTKNQANSTAANPASNRQQPTANPAGHDVNDGFSLSVYQPSANARSYYNLTSRPAAQFGNGNVSLLFPLSIPAAITSAFGWRVHPVMGGARFHAGTDLGAPQGTPVLAALDGKVEIADFVGGYGLAVVLQHNKGTEQTLYGHLSEIFVQPGDTVKQGEAIGRVGSTGLSTGPHLHFELRKLTQEGWTLLDPGPSLEYALLHFESPTQVAQVNDLKLPTFFKYSGKFLGSVEIAAQNNAAPNVQVATANSTTQSSIVTRDRQITATRTQLTR